MNQLTSILLFSLATLICSCGGSSIPSNPVKEMGAEFEIKYDYYILLNDMDLKDDQYLHKYTVVDIKKIQKLLLVKRIGKR